MSEEAGAATAFHEAGHAVACVVLRRGLKYVTILPDDDTVGHCRYLSGDSSPDPRGYIGPLVTEADWKAMARWEQAENARCAKAGRMVRRNVVIAAAGPVAEARFLGKDRDEIVALASSDSDVQHMVNAALSDTGDPNVAGRLVQSAIEEAEGLLSKHWAAVEHVASALLRRRKLSGPYVRDLVAVASAPDVSDAAVREPKEVMVN